MTSRSLQTLFIGQELIRLNEVDSTNTFALDLLRIKEVNEGATVTAQAQFQGRGQRGNFWISEPGKNIICSIILKPTFLSVTNQFDLTRAVALGIIDAIAEIVPVGQLKIKWPNDIFVNDKKVGGILIENVINGDKLSAAVVGIGVNVNQSSFGTDAPNAASLFQLRGKQFSVVVGLESIFTHVEAHYLQLRAGNVEKLRSDYEEKLYRKGIKSRYTDFKNEFEATLDHVTDEGMLVLKREDGTEKKFGFKEVGFL
jgi:BirA family biotin operon repressor/biotin-[acetyl-CoA-carboxylase] ligase